MEETYKLCFECGEAPATEGHVCARCYTLAMEEAHRVFYRAEEQEQAA